MTMVKHCPRCNRSEDEVAFYGEFCEDCARKDVLEKVKNRVGIVVCKKCGRIRVSGEMLDFTKDNLESAINKSIKTNRFKLVEYDDKTAKGFIMERTRDGTIKSPFEVELDRKSINCENCFKKAGGYFEATFQLRGDMKKANVFLGRIERYFEKHGGFVTKTEKVSGGLEVYVSHKSIASALISSDRLKTVRSYTLAGVKNGKQVYRNTYTVRFEDEIVTRPVRKRDSL